jgi:nucleotide-binding universal stress UspA family protein
MPAPGSAVVDLDPYPVLVGYDGSDAARGAVLTAAGAALLRGRQLHIVHVVEQDAHDSRGTAVLTEGLDVARPVLSATQVRAQLLAGRAAEVLLELAGDAELVVLGRGRAAHVAGSVGSVALRVVSHAPGPVVVVPDSASAGPSAGVIVVGVDGVEDSEAALATAFAEADRRGAPVTAVHAWEYPQAASSGEVLPLVYDREWLADDERRILVEALRPFREKFPHVSVTERVVEGTAATALVDASSDAQLVVVGTRGRSPVRAVFLGSVARAAIRGAHCPVLVARQHATR